ARVRETAEQAGFHVYKKQESQEICFIPGGNYRWFIRQYMPEASSPGPIVNKQGEVLGYHHGITGYTIGQRRGLGVSSGKPLYVIHIDPESNTLMVGSRKEGYHTHLVADKVNWIEKPPEEPVSVQAKIRSLHPPQDALLYRINNSRAQVDFSTPQWAVAPGQSAVFYIDDRVVGGGIISYGE
ncbi:MAG: tRNA methyl transferase PRC-barrel domain-containing protein, partial [Spirochaetota bacterium]